MWALRLLLTSGVLVQCSTPVSSNAEAVNVHWIEDPPAFSTGVTFGLPWARGRHFPNTTVFRATSSGNQVDLQTWITAYWPDGSIKWTGNAFAGTQSVADVFRILPSPKRNISSAPKARQTRRGDQLDVSETLDEIIVATGKITVSFPKSGDALISSIRTPAGKTVGKNGRLVLRSQSHNVEDDEGGSPDVKYYKFTARIHNVTVTGEGDPLLRTLVTVRGIHVDEGAQSTHHDWLPFTVRFYLYANSEAIRTVHTIIYDGDPASDFISGLGIRFDVPLKGEELYNRHVRIAGVEGGILHEAVQGITGLRRDPGRSVRDAQYTGNTTPDLSTWPATVANRLQWVPTWNDYRLTQLSPDGFNIKKRTKPGQSWLKIPGGTRAGGLAYLGGSTVGGMAIGLRDFWKKYPTGLDIANAATDEGSLTLWLYSPSGEPLDVRPYHDGLGQNTYKKQLDALEITYEDYEEGYNTPFGIARTSEVFIYAFDSTPDAERLSALTRQMNSPPALVAESSHLRDTKALGSYWSTPGSAKGPSATVLESNLDFLVKFYQNQIEQRRWYGFWDHGDIQHGYDGDRHTWKYDIGGYAWDNSELSPDLFFWTYFLRTGRADVYRIAEAQARHGSEVDTYHLGNFTGLGTRHGVQHWSDSAKQVRISTPVYRKAFYYLSGGDERVGDIIQSVLEAEKAFYLVDARRKVRDPNVVYTPDPTALYLNFGTDWAGIAAAYLLEWERRGPRWKEARGKLLETMKTFPKLKYGFITGEALYNSETGAWAPPPTDPGNLGNVSVSHLSAVFGVLETIDELIEHYEETPKDFIDAWLDYCYYYGASKAEQRARYGRDFGSLSLRQGHSRLTAYAANKRRNSTLATRAWDEFMNDNSPDELSASDPWTTIRINGSKSLTPVDEAAWITTNAAALFGLAAIENLALIGEPGTTNSTVQAGKGKQ